MSFYTRINIGKKNKQFCILTNNKYGKGNYLINYLYAIILLCTREHEECMKFMDRHERQTKMTNDGVDKTFLMQHIYIEKSVMELI